jgi:hypothetical protein
MDGSFTYVDMDHAVSTQIGNIVYAGVEGLPRGTQRANQSRVKGNWRLEGSPHNVM